MTNMQSTANMLNKNYNPKLTLLINDNAKPCENAPRALNIIPIMDITNTKPLARNCTSEPLKNIDDIRHIVTYFISHAQYRNAMWFIIGIRTGLRISDITELKFKDFINPDMTFKNTLVVFEKKTRHTRNQAKNRYISIHDDIKRAIELYLNHTPNVTLEDYLFTSESNNKTHRPMSRQAIDGILKNTIHILGIHCHCSTHTLRKTFAYHTIMQAKDKTRAIQQLQMLLKHSSQLCTLRYAGITDDELTKTYQNLDFKLDDILRLKREEKAL